MAVVKDIFRILKNGIWDEHHFRTSADQVVYTKPDGTASNVQAELAAQNSTLKPLGKKYHAYTRKSDKYQAGSYINFNGDGALDLGSVVFNQGGTVTIKEPMIALVIIRLSGSSTANRIWMQLLNYNKEIMLAESITYGEYSTGEIVTCLDLDSNTVLGVKTREDITMNAGGLSSTMEIIRIR